MTNLTKEEEKGLENFIQSQIDHYIPKRYRDCSKDDIPKEVAEKINKALEEGKGLFFYGQAGTGKTHIMYAILKEFITKRINSFSFVDMPFLSIKIKNYIKEDTDPIENVRIYTRPDYLFIDDLGVEKMTDFLFENLYLIIDTRYKDLKQCFISSNYSIKEISENINDRIASRISEMCEIIHLKGEDKRVN